VPLEQHRRCVTRAAMRAADQLAVRRLNHRHTSITGRNRFCVPGTRHPAARVHRAMALTHSQPSGSRCLEWPPLAAWCWWLQPWPLWHGIAHATAAARQADPWDAYTHQWTRLPSPPQARTGVALAWTGNELVSSAVPFPASAHRRATATRLIRTGRWSRIPPAPGQADRRHACGRKRGAAHRWIRRRQAAPRVALDPTTNTWRRIPTRPIPNDSRGRRLDGTR
jgi:hypothetical protein